MPTYNRERFLPEAVASVVAQSYERWELLVVDDGSTDGTRVYLESQTDNRIRSIFRAHQGNPAVLRNVAAKAARGSYVAFLDSDDLWLPQKLALQIEDLLAHPECGWSYTGRVCVDEHGRDARVPGLRSWAPYGGWILEQVLDLRALVATSAVVIQRRLFDAVGGFNEWFARCEDFELWIRLAEASPATAVRPVLVQKRLHPEDRGTVHLDVLAYMNRIYGDLLQRTDSGAIGRLCRRQRTRVGLDIVGRYRRARRYAEARRALRATFPHTAGHPAWWAELLKTCLAQAVPSVIARRLRS